VLDDAYAIVMQSGKVPEGIASLAPGAEPEAIRIVPESALLILEEPLPGVGGRDRRLVLAVRDLCAGRALVDGASALAIGLLAALVIPLPLALRRFRRWTMGLHHLHTGIRRLALESNLEPVPVGGDDEVAYLSLAFNDMAAKLTANKRELVKANQTLERRVAERTEELHAANATLEKQNEKLEELTETALRFTDDVAHEFRTPLAVIMEFASIISDGIGGDVTEQQAGYLQYISDASTDLSRLVDDFLDSSKLRARSLRVDRRPHEVEGILDAVWPALEARAASAGVSLERRCEPDLPSVYADAEKAGRTLMNLAVNAFKFSGEGSTVTIDVGSAGGGAVAFRVTDQGPGLSEDELATLFERFRQTSSGRRSSAKGFGLGLSIVQELVALNLGTVTVDSVLGEGSTFGFTVPTHDPEAIVDMQLAGIRARSPEGAVGLLRVSAGAEVADEALAAYLGSHSYPLDVQFPLPQGVLLVGATGSAEAWGDRLVGECDATDGRSGIALRVEEAVTCTPDQARERVLSSLFTVTKGM
jgi:signal transduction histidine kinase